MNSMETEKIDELINNLDIEIDTLEYLLAEINGNKRSN